MDRQHYRWAFFIIVFLLASVYFFVFSESGLFERIALDKEKSRVAANIEAQKSENKRLQRMLERYRGGAYPEGEIADSGYVKNGGRVLIVREAGKKAVTAKAATGEPGDFPLALPYLRITWIAISALIVIAMILFGRKLSENNRQLYDRNSMARNHED